jgi:hypothetical protein
MHQNLNCAGQPAQPNTRSNFCSLGQPANDASTPETTHPATRTRNERPLSFAIPLVKFKLFFVEAPEIHGPKDHRQKQWQSCPQQRPHPRGVRASLQQDSPTEEYYEK